MAAARNQHIKAVNIDLFIIHILLIDISVWRSWGVVYLGATSCSCEPPGVNHTSLSGAVGCGISGGGVDSGSVDWGLG